MLMKHISRMIDYFKKKKKDSRLKMLKGRDTIY